jgi:CubicO group peptidase (beta-lactamase class C family)
MPHATAIATITTAISATALASPAFNFDEVTRLCRGAVQGQNIETPVRGFEVRILHQGNVVFSQSFGDWSDNRLANTDSSTKTISGAVIMSLTERSAQPFSLDTRLSQYIPQFSGAKQNITVRQAFCHTAGLGGTSAEGSQTLTLQQAAVQIAGALLRYTPGTSFLYAGSSMHAAGAVAELASGMPWNQLFAERITTPLGLTNTTFVLTTPTNPRIAGGVESNAAEFAVFMEMLRNRGLHGSTRVLSEASVNTMFTRQPAPGIPIISSPFNNSSDYGIGVWLDRRDANGRLLSVLAAGARGFQSWIDFDEQVTGVFSTEFSSSGNTVPFTYLVRQATQFILQSPQLPGDANLDSALDRLDLNILAANFNLSQRLWIQGDFTGDGRANNADLARIQTKYNPDTFAADWLWAQNRNRCPADYNGDAQADFFDYLDFAADFSSDAPLADVNNDNQVDFFDYLDFVGNFNQGC